jgi:hypothetical protein
MNAQGCVRRVFRRAHGAALSCFVWLHVLHSVLAHQKLYFAE